MQCCADLHFVQKKILHRQNKTNAESFLFI